jgi:hypothetical protein
MKLVICLYVCTKGALYGYDDNIILLEIKLFYNVSLGILTKTCCLFFFIFRKLKKTREICLKDEYQSVAGGICSGVFSFKMPRMCFHCKRGEDFQSPCSWQASHVFCAFWKNIGGYRLFIFRRYILLHIVELKSL